MQIELNPFASKFTSPSDCSFVEDKHSRQMMEILVFGMNLRNCVQIIGPHGAGKTTFAVYAAKKLSERYRQARLITIRRSRPQRISSLSVTSEHLFQSQHCRDDSELAIIDGLEQLSGLQRWLLVQALLNKKIGLLVTCHKPISFIRYRITLNPSPERFKAVAHSLLENSSIQLSDCDIEEVYKQCDGNYRTGLSLLYDCYAQKARQSLAGLAC